jgi:hypothetical protein
MSDTCMSTCACNLICRGSFGVTTPYVSGRLLVGNLPVFLINQPRYMEFAHSTSRTEYRPRAQHNGAALK